MRTLSACTAEAQLEKAVLERPMGTQMHYSVISTAGIFHYLRYFSFTTSPACAAVAVSS